MCKKKIWYLFSFVLVICFYLNLAFLLEYKKPGRNPDRYYHFAISKMTSEKGLIRSLPQADDLGWGRYFPEKEFLFHQITAIGYRMYGDYGVICFCGIIGIAICLILFIMASSYLHPAYAALLIILFALNVPYFSSRIFMVRPHMLAILWYLIIIYGYVKQKKWLVLTGSALFILSYHAFFIVFPIIAGVLAALLAGRGTLSGQEMIFWKKSLIFLLTGLSLGILINPYFPANLIMGWEHLNFALLPSAQDLSEGSELAKRPLSETIRHFFPHIAFIIGTGATLFCRRKTKNSNYMLLVFLFIVSSCYFLLTAVSIRASEYFVPSSIVMTVICISEAKAAVSPKIIAGIFLLLLYFPISFFYQSSTAGRNEHFMELTMYIRKAIQTVPPESAGKKIFHTEWILGEFILYERPDMKFVDLLDPRLLMNVSPYKYKLIKMLNNGNITDPYDMLKKVFKADFLLTTNPTVCEMAEKDSRFKLLYPDKDKNLRIRMYAL